MSRTERRIAHLDMDAFFASVSLLRYPDLQGQAVVIGGHGPAPQPGAYARLRDYVGRGVLTTANYEARRFGVHSAMGMMKAARLAPDAILLPVDFPRYRRYSSLFKAAVAGVAPLVEDRGIDEIYIDLSFLPDSSLVIAQALQQAVLQATGLTCSIGISPNKLLSKIASDLNKPAGITILQPDDLQQRIWPLPVSKINGIGPKSTRKLADLSIQTIAQLAQADPLLLQRHFGLTYARWLLDVAHGIDERPVVTHSEPRSISRETTFDRDLHVRHDRQALASILRDLCARLADDLARKQVRSGTIGIKLRFADFSIITRDLSLSESIGEADAILQAARACLKRVRFEQRMRLMGVRASRLEPSQASPDQPQPEQLSLY